MIVFPPEIDEVHGHLLRQPASCRYCGLVLDWTRKKLRPQLDHGQPISRGGNASIDNIVPACGGCNRAKGDLTFSEFVALRGFLEKTFEDRGKSLLARLKRGYFR
jgi:5-methylcytosine-specific restriction endonuclease McrA